VVLSRESKTSWIRHGLSGSKGLEPNQAKDDAEEAGDDMAQRRLVEGGGLAAGSWME
jgi:hypothetical protein